MNGSLRGGLGTKNSQPELVRAARPLTNCSDEFFRANSGCVRVIHGVVPSRRQYLNNLP